MFTIYGNIKTYSFWKFTIRNIMIKVTQKDCSKVEVFVHTLSFHIIVFFYLVFFCFPLLLNKDICDFQSIGHMSICPYVCVCVCVRQFTFEVSFNGLFAPTSQSRMFKIFRDSKFLGKSNAKKWSQIWRLLLKNGVKLPRKKSLYLGEFCLTEQEFFGIGVSHSV